MERAQIEKISRALADKTRLMIFEAIAAAGQMNCGEIVSMRGVTPATVSHHLKILNEAGLIVCRRQRQFVYSETVPETVEAYAQAVAAIGRKAGAHRKFSLKKATQRKAAPRKAAPAARGPRA